jgi:hypothetical protein
MSMWLYQMNQQQWGPNRFRLEIWEGERWSWEVGNKLPATEEPEPGDTVLFFYAPSGGHDAGFYGWGVISKWMKEERALYFIPTAPTNHLKMHPWWDDEAKEIADTIRGTVKQATLWSVGDDMVTAVRRGFTGWVAAHSGKALKR